MPIITRYDQIEELPGGPTEAETALLEACKAGEPCLLGNLPPEGPPPPDRIVRAEVLRYLILGGCDAWRVQGYGVRLVGAYVEGTLDLSYAKALGITDLSRCKFESGIEARQAKLSTLNLTRSQMPGLNAQDASIAGHVSLREVRVAGKTSLVGATIGGQVVCNGGYFSCPAGKVLDFQGASLKSDVFLRSVIIQGEVSFSGATIAGQFFCLEARLSGSDGKALNLQRATIGQNVVLNASDIRGETWLSGTRISGQFSADGATFSGGEGHAINLQGVTISDGLFWRNTTVETGVVDLSSARISDIVDDLRCWPDHGRLLLNGITYDRIHGELDARLRLQWLAKGSYFEGDFHSQPYTQLAKVYRTIGRDGDARKVLRERERLEHKDFRRRWKDVPDGLWRVGFNYLGRQWSEPLLRAWDHLLRATIGYGYAPFRALWWLAGLWVIAALLAHFTWATGDFAPDSDVIQTSAAWTILTDTQNPAEAWSAEQGRDWETFNAIAYAADLVIPIIDLNQTDAWTPSTNRGPWGQRLWRYGFLMNIAGWFITALGAAAITGVIQRGRD